MRNDTFKTDEEIIDMLKALNINPSKVKRIRIGYIPDKKLLNKKLLIKFKDGHSANFIIKQGNKNEILT